jgi:signal transduction histidine kinase
MSADHAASSVGGVERPAAEARAPEDLLRQRERMAVLGSLAAGLAHELNNPASAASRAAGLLREQLDALQALTLRLAEHPWKRDEVALLRQLADLTHSASQSARELAPLARADREEAVEQWLEKHDVSRSWELAPLLVDRGLTAEQLERITRGCDAAVVIEALAWTEHTSGVRQLLDELAQSTARISEIVRAVKAYSYADATALRTADLHEGIENGLTILGHKLREAKATVVREYDRALPPIESYGTELTQVWINLIDNAADAVAPNGGTIRVRTRSDNAGIAVEVADTGSGISEDASSHILEPFFTTKPAGKGTGLGLDIVQRIVARHHGTLEFASKAGETRFIVRLPVGQRSRLDG